MGRIDVHTHLLPGIDDGPTEMAAGLEMARLAEADGTEVIVATPHQKDVALNSSVAALRELYDRFCSELASTSPKASPAGSMRLRVALGMENHIEPELPDWVRTGDALPLNGTKFILCEPPFEAYPLYLDDTLFRLQQQGLVPIIAHPERCLPFQRQPARLAALVARGMLVQVTGSSLLGEFARPARRSAEAFLKAGLVHMIASDMHRPERSRLPLLSQAHQRTAELVGEERAHQLFVDTPRAVIEGRDPAIDLVALRPGRHRWWQPWRGSGR